MKKINCLILTLSLLFTGGAYAQKDSLEIRDLLASIDSMYEAQNSPYIQVMQGEISADSAQKKAGEIQVSNYKVLKLIVKKYHYPNINLYSNSHVTKFNELIGKCTFDTAFQKLVLQYFREESVKDVNLKNSVNYLNQLAGLIDRLEVILQREQVYGTQVDFNEEKNQFVLKPTIDIQNLNKRRKEMKLENIETVLQEANQKMMEMRAQKKIQ